MTRLLVHGYDRASKGHQAFEDLSQKKDQNGQTEQLSAKWLKIIQVTEMNFKKCDSYPHEFHKDIEAIKAEQAGI